MAKCEACGKEMLEADGCDYKFVLTPDGKKYERKRVGEEGYIKPDCRCGDCGAKYGFYHHPYCDIEPCPVCGGQLLSCFCDISAFTVA